MGFDWASVIKPNRSSVNAQDLDGFEDVLGFALPDDYRDFLLRFNGGRVVVEHKFRVPEIPFDLGMEYFSPFKALSLPTSLASVDRLFEC